MNNKSLHWICPILVLILIGACSPITKVTVNPPAAKIQLTDYQTFDFSELEASGDTTSDFHQNMELFKNMVINEMNIRGLTQNTRDPDLKINLGIVVEEKTQTRQTSLADPGEWDYIGQRNYKWESQTVKVGTYKKGSVTLHLVDNERNEAVWVGVIEGILPDDKDKRDRAMKKGVKALFKKIDQAGG